MKKLLILLFLFISAFSFSQSLSDLQLEPEYDVAFFDFYPLSYINEEGEYTGFIIDLLNRFALDNGTTFNYIPMHFVDGVQAIKDGEIDLIINFAYSEERAEYANFNINSLLTSHGAVYVSFDNNDISSVFDIQGKSVGILKGDINSTNFDKYIQSFNITVEHTEYLEITDAINGLILGEIDAVVLPFVVGSQSSEIKPTEIIFSPTTAHVASPINMNENLVSAIDIQVLNWRSDPDGFYYEVYNKYFTYDETYSMPIWLRYLFILITIVAALVTLWIFFLKKQIIISKNKIELNESKYRNLFQNMTSGFSLNKVVRANDGRIVSYIPIECNKMFAKITGIEPERMIGKDIRQFLPDIEDYWLDTFFKVVETGTPSKYENYNKDLDKIFETTVFKPYDDHFAIVFYDITEKKRRENLIKESEEKLRITFENMGDAILVFDTDLKVTMMNEAAESIIHWNEKYCLNKHADELFTQANFFYEGQTMSDLLEESMSKRKTLKIGTAKFHCTGDRHLCVDHVPADYWIEDSMSPIIDDDDNVKGVVIVFRDVTDKIENELKTQDLEQKLIQSQKMEALGQFSGGIAHDFNNIVTAINGYTDLALESSNPDDEKTLRYLKNIKEAGRRSAELTKKILAFSRQQIIETEVIDVNKTIDLFLDITERITDEDIELQKYFNSTKKIKADVNQIERIILNLISNAKFAVNEKTQIASNKRIIVETNDRIFEGKSYVEIVVSDSGTGISDENLKKIFEPFFTTKDIDKGSGMGLATVYGIVKQNKGDIKVYSEEGIGTSVRILWPSTDDDIIVEEIEEDQFSEKGDKTILFVEDELQVLNLTSEFLRERGFDVYTADNGASALKQYSEKLSEIDLIITDVIMPKMNGEEFIKEVRKITKRPKVLYTSGYTKTHIVENGIITSGIHFLSKPYDLSELMRKVSEILDT